MIVTCRGAATGVSGRAVWRGTMEPPRAPRTPSLQPPGSLPVADETLPIDRDLFDLLVCPAARVPLKLVGGKLISTDAATRRAYRIDDGIPVMLVEESVVLSEADWRAAMAENGPVGAGVTAV